MAMWYDIYIGVCHSDIHQVKKFARSYPFVAGHEVIGEVIAIGSSVTMLTIGQRVGIGCQTNSCGITAAHHIITYIYIAHTLNEWHLIWYE